ncbi:MAG: VWA domain-containing protein [Myxococcaceae bacterium]|nr:VWA domain-containing protein [Myxococcaceae bacterium]
MSFGAPLGLLALLALAPVVAAYFLRRKQPPRVVSALFLWRSPDPRAEAGPKLERFSREASLALEALAIAAAALFLADARCGEVAPTAHLVVVLDGSLSMRATVDGASAADRARDEVARLVRAEGAAALTLVESGLKPRVLAGPQLQVARALAALEGWVPSQPAHDVAPAFTLARELATGREQPLFFLTDGPPGAVALPPSVQGRSVGRRAPNVAFLSALRRDVAGVATVTVRVGNFTDEARTVQVRLDDGRGVAHETPVTMGPGASAALRVGLRTSAEVRATLPGDALPDDGDLVLPPAPDEGLAVEVLEGLDVAARAAVTRALSAVDGVTLGAPAGLAVGPPGSAATVRLGAVGELASFVGPFFAKKTNPLLDDVQLGGVVWTAGAGPVPGEPLLSAGTVVLASEGDDGVVHLNLDLTRSNVQRSVAWPVLWGNLARRARTARQGFPRRLVSLGEDVAVVTAPGRSWSLEGPSGEARPLLGVGALSLPALTPPGAWRLLADGVEVDRLAVVPLDAAESDLRTRGPWAVEAPRVTALASLASSRPRAFGFVVVALAALLVDFWLTARRRA